MYFLDNIISTAAPPQSGSCDGVPITNWGCCTSQKKCAVGGGDCDSDTQCSSGLKCGTNNCQKDFSTSGSNWDSTADCCEGMLFYLDYRS